MECFAGLSEIELHSKIVDIRNTVEEEMYLKLRWEGSKVFALLD